MKVPLTDQIAAATRHRDRLERDVRATPDLMPDLHAAEATILTLALLAANETEYRQFLQERNTR